MECYNCKFKLINQINQINKNNQNNTGSIAKKYKEYNLCSGCNDGLFLFGFLGDIKNPSIIFEKEKISIDLNKIVKKTKGTNKK
jgi:hypothetical protein